MLEEANATLLESLKIYVSHYGDTHELVAFYNFQIGKVNYHQGRVEEAKERLIIARNICSTLNPEGHPRIHEIDAALEKMTQPISYKANQQPSFWNRHKNAIMTGAVSAAVIGGVAAYLYKRK